MNKQKDFTSIFLIEFTKALIENSNKSKIIEIKQRAKISQPKEIQRIQKIKNPKRILKKTPIKQLIQNPINQMPSQKRPILRIPKPRLPPRFQNIMPVPTKIDLILGKLNPLLQNPRTVTVECDGPDTPIRVVERTKRKINTKITLTKEEIDAIIQTFSEKKKIPVIEGVYKIAAGNLILLAVVSEVVGSKFVITKIPQQRPSNRPATRRIIRSM